MAFGSSKNRRKVDTAQRQAKAVARARIHGPTVLRFLAVLTVCVTLVYGGYTTYRWAIAAPFFGLKQVRFTGLTQATDVELARLAGLSSGQNLWRMDPAAIERAMRQHPWVKSIDVRRQFPAAVQITVAEHVAVAVTSLGDLYLVDAEGEPFKRVQVGDSVDLPVITGVSREAYVQDPLKAAEELRSALEYADAYRATQLEAMSPLAEIRLEDDRVTLITGKDGQEVRLPRGADADADADRAARLDRLAQVRVELARRAISAEVIHLDNRARPGWVAVKVSAPVSERIGRSVQ